MSADSLPLPSFMLVPVNPESPDLTPEEIEEIVAWHLDQMVKPDGE